MISMSMGDLFDFLLLRDPETVGGSDSSATLRLVCGTRVTSSGICMISVGQTLVEPVS